MSAESFEIYRIDRRFTTFGVRPFVLVEAYISQQTSLHTFSAAYLILHANAPIGRKLRVSPNLIPSVVQEANRLEFVKEAAFDDALGRLSSDIAEGGEVVSDIDVSAVTLLELLSARMRGVVALPEGNLNRFPPNIYEALDRLGNTQLFLGSDL